MIMKNSRWYLLLTLFVMILCHGLQAQNVNDTSVVVRISGSARYYYGSTANNDSVNGLALQSALTAAAASDTFLLRSSSTGGTFQGNFTATEAGLALKGGYVGNAAEWHFNDVISDSSSLDGAQRGRVLLLSATSGTSIIENLVFKEGEVSGTDNYGAGLKLGNGGSLQLQGCSKFISNSATMHAGALVLVNGTAVIQDSVLFISNHANVDGGAISILGTTLTIKDKVKFITNDCVDYYGMGGAIYQESGVMTITDSVYFYDNSSGGGGADRKRVV